QPAAFQIRAGLLIVWLQLNVSGFRSVLARGWHGYAPRCGLLQGLQERQLCDGTATYTEAFAGGCVEAVASLVNDVHCRFPFRLNDGIVTAEEFLSMYRLSPRSGSRHGSFVSQQKHRLPYFPPSDVCLG